MICIFIYLDLFTRPSILITFINFMKRITIWKINEIAIKFSLMGPHDLYNIDFTIDKRVIPLLIAALKLIST